MHFVAIFSRVKTIFVYTPWHFRRASRKSMTCCECRFLTPVRTSSYTRAWTCIFHFLRAWNAGEPSPTFYRDDRENCVSMTTRDGGGSYCRPKSKRRQPCLNVHWLFLCGVDLGVPKARLWGSNTKMSLSSLSHSQIKWEFMSVSPHSCHRVASPASSDSNLLTSPNLPRITHRHIYYRLFSSDTDHTYRWRW